MNFRRMTTRARLFVAFLLLALSIAIGLCTFRSRTRIDLPLTLESLPPHAALTAAWWNDDGTRALVVGRGGDVLERRNVLGEVGAATWTRVDLGTNDDLYAIASGDGPWRFLPDHMRVLVVGAHGAFFDCTQSPCKRLDSGTDHGLRGVAVAGGQALVVGEGGTILHIAPNPLSLANVESDALIAERQHVEGGAQTLDAVWLGCHFADFTQVCAAVAVGAAGSIVEGRGTGFCDNAKRLSGVTGRHCAWTWSRVTSPIDDDLVAVWPENETIVASTRSGQRIHRGTEGRWARGEIVADAWNVVRVSVRFTETRLWWTRTWTRVSTMAFGNASFAKMNDAWSALEGAPRFVAGATASGLAGDETLLITDGGDVFLAR